MWGVGIGLVMVTAGIVLIVIATQSLDDKSKREEKAVFATVMSADDRQIITGNGTAGDGTSYSAFINTSTFGFVMDAPVYVSFYAYNLTNAQQVLQGQAHPEVEQIGPYVYEKRSKKINVTLEDSSEEDKLSAPELAGSFGRVSYQVVDSYYFAPDRSNGSENDVLVTANASYIRTLQKLAHEGYSERLLLADFAHQHFKEYSQQLHGEFIAETKKRAWGHYLPVLIDRINRESLARVLKRQRDRVTVAAVPENLVRMHALTRTEMIPQVLTDVFRDISDRFLPGILQDVFAQTTRAAIPRVLSVLQRRLQVESVPVLLREQLRVQQARHVPLTLGSLEPKIQQVAFPYVLKEVYDRACLEAVPLALRSIRNEIIQRDINDNAILAPVAQKNLITRWRKRGSTAIDFDAFFDDVPTNVPRTGFELLPSTASLQISDEAATLLLGLRPSNLRFSIVDYNTTEAANVPLSGPLSTPIGFAIWKQVIALNETAINYVMEGVNNDVALTTDALTREQLMFLRDYLMNWAQSPIIQRDRERFWRQHFTTRSTNAGFNEPDVDLDVEKLGTQTGFSLHQNGPSTSGITNNTAVALWNSTSSLSFVNPQGFTVWWKLIGTSATSPADVTAARQTLLSGIDGLTSAQLDEVIPWLQSLLSDGFVRRRALRHWSEGTCVSMFGTPLTDCLKYDLDPLVEGLQHGFEMNPTSDVNKTVSQGTREALWNASHPASFLQDTGTIMMNSTVGYGLWLRGIQTGNLSRLITAIDTASPPPLTDLTTTTAKGISEWLMEWQSNQFNSLHVLDWWRASTCWDREVLNASTTTSTVTNNLPSCTVNYTETITASKLTQANTESPFFEWDQLVDVNVVECVFDKTRSSYTSNSSTYQMGVRTYSCDRRSATLVDDPSSVVPSFGFELAPLRNETSSLSLAAAMVLWDAQNPLSFLDWSGYKQWVVGDTTDADLAAQLNPSIVTACAAINVGGLNSGVFNKTLGQSCGTFTAAHVATVRSWILSQQDRRWAYDALLDHWRRGDAFTLDLEPYRTGHQAGWELASGCECSVAEDNSTRYSVPATALALWSPAANNASFLTTSGLKLWTNLIDAELQNDSSRMNLTRISLGNAMPSGRYEPWMDVVAAWLSQWQTNEYALRDVLGHWMFARCPTTPTTTIPESDVEEFVVTSSDCTRNATVNPVTHFNESLDDLQAMASRPTTYFDPKFAEKAALEQPRRLIEVTTTWVTCEAINSTAWNESTRIMRSTNEYQACNFVAALDAYKPEEQHNPPFELNATSNAQQWNVTIDAALALWSSSSTIGFTNVTTFLSRWHDAISDTEVLKSLETETSNLYGGPVTLSRVLDYLSAWEASDPSIRRVAATWVAQSVDQLDLDLKTPGAQVGFELYPTGTMGTASTPPLPTVDQAIPLLTFGTDYSLLIQDTKLAWEDGLPRGFDAWKEIYDGQDDSSEALIEAYPPRAATLTNDRPTYQLSDSDRQRLIERMANATSLSAAQLRTISRWCLSWATSDLLRAYVLQVWATGVTPRGDSSSAYDLVAKLPQLFSYSSTSSDLFTVASSELANVTAANRALLWDVRTLGALPNPTTDALWCAITDGNTIQSMCPHTMDDYGRITTASMTVFRTVVEPVSGVPIVATSNFSELAIQYLSYQFELDRAQVLTIARWVRAVPTKSIFFQVREVSKWASANTVSPDPSAFGYDLGFVFPRNKFVPRNASSDVLMTNAVSVNGSSIRAFNCNHSIELLLELWDSMESFSFVNNTGMNAWLANVDGSSSGGDDVAFLLRNSDFANESFVSSLKPQQMECTIKAIIQWLGSWQKHPFLRAAVESLWYDPRYAAAFISKGASPELASFPLPQVQNVNTSRWSALARVLFDPTQPGSFLYRDIGLQLWEAQLGNCTTTNRSTGACMTSVDSNASSSAGAVQALTAQMPPINGHEVLETPVVARIVKWMVSWLDNPMLLAFIVQEQIASSGSSESASGFVDLAAIQFVNASISAINYSQSDAGVLSQRETLLEIDWIDETQSLETRNVTKYRAFPELSAFCKWNDVDALYAYDSPSTCGINGQYSLTIAEASELLAVISDDDIQVAVGGMAVSRSALLLDALLAEPTLDADSCAFLADRIADAYDWDNTTRTHLCVIDTTTNSVHLEFPMLANITSVKPSSFKADVRAFVHYVGTKLGFEMHVLGLAGVEASMPSMPSSRAVPLGGYFAVQRINEFLFGPHAQLWTNGTVASSRLSVRLPIVDDLALFSQQKLQVGEIVTINNDTWMNTWGSRFPLKQIHPTDGSIFTSALRANDDVFPPPSLTFYWDYSRRLVQADYARNVTRYGMDLLRYAVTSWRNPSTLPTGLTPLVTASVTARLAANMSKVYDELPLALSDADEPSVVDVDPLTGLVWNRKLQWLLSIYVSHNFTSVWHANVTAALMPLLTVREQATVTDITAASMQSSIQPGPFAPEKIGEAGAIAGAVMLVVGVLATVVALRRARFLRLKRMQEVVPDESEMMSQSMHDTGDVREQAALVDASNSSSNSAVPPEVLEDVSLENASLVGQASSSPRRGSIGARGRKLRRPSQIERIVEETEDAVLSSSTLPKQHGVSSM
ncbi:TPA: hypothetical protein N0F65_012885 [Lagenidium giganteum]|uniref:Uncharacterized protein n=1 Tax=Lagenidium giganteum TaxID=4803 RepID=A0AAV2YKU4_9STRA|nr:TPA: hypothetical protein N0F65_012885 [Lagenidium giganteum]